MIQILKLELLKVRRTKSFLFGLLITVAGVFWEISAKYSQAVNPELHQVSTLFNNQTVDVIVAPIAVTVFVLRIVRGEQVGKTFKLQQSNGQTYLSIFKNKLLLSVVFFAILALLEISLISLFAVLVGLIPSLSLLCVKFLGLILTDFCLLCLYLTLALLTEKQGLVLGLGFLGAFFGLILMQVATKIWSFIFPWLGSSYLSPYHFYVVDNNVYEYVKAPDLMLRFLLYVIFAFVIYRISLSIISKKMEV